MRYKFQSLTSRLIALCTFVLYSTLISAVKSEPLNNPQGVSALTYFTEIYPPSSYYQDGQLTGMSVETLRLVWQELNLPEQEIIVVPWARGVKQLDEHSNTVLFAMSKTAGRTPKYKWVGPIADVHYVILARRNAIAPIHAIRDLKHHNIVVIRNDITEIVVKEAGVNPQQIVEAKNAEQSMKLFKSGRVSTIAISRSGYRDAVNKGELDSGKYHEIYQLKTMSDYFAFSKDTSDDIIRFFQNGLDRVRSKNKSLQKRYLQN